MKDRERLEGVEGRVEERDELSLEQAAELLGLSPGALLDLLREAGMRVEQRPLRIRASEVQALRREREKSRRKTQQELNRLSEALAEEEAEEG